MDKKDIIATLEWLAFVGEATKDHRSLTPDERESLREFEFGLFEESENEKDISKS